MDKYDLQQDASVKIIAAAKALIRLGDDAGAWEVAQRDPLLAKGQVTKTTWLCWAKKGLFQVGDVVHLGLSEAGGTGYKGKITKFHGAEVYVESLEPHIFGPRVWKGSIANLSYCD